MKRIFWVLCFFLIHTVAQGAQAVLRLGQGSGELGSQNNIIRISLENDVPVHALQMAIADVPDFLKPDSVWVTSRCAHFIVSGQDDSTGSFNVILVSLDPTQAIAPDTGAVLNISYSVANQVNQYNNLQLMFLTPPTVYNKQLGKIPTTTLSGSFVIGSTGVEEGQPSGAPGDFQLLQNYPNPFNPETQIRFTLPAGDHAVVQVFNLLGQRIRTLADREFAAGMHQLHWDASDEQGEMVAAGVYMFRITTSRFSAARRMVLAK
jgi:hypothetical protein